MHNTRIKGQINKAQIRFDLQNIFFFAFYIFIAFKTLKNGTTRLRESKWTSLSVQRLEETAQYILKAEKIREN